MRKVILIILSMAAFAFSGDSFVLLESSKSGKELIKSVSDAVAKAGFTAADERDLNVAYQKQFEQSDFELFYNLTVFDPKALSASLPQNPRLAGFVPYTVLIYQKKGDKKSDHHEKMMSAMHSWHNFLTKTLPNTTFARLKKQKKDA